MRNLMLLVLLFALAIPTNLSSQSQKQTDPIEVITWVPPYGINASKAAANANFGACSAKDGLTRIGLQFWTPNNNGTIKYANHEAYTPNDADVTWWKNWGATNDVEILLCIYNNIGSWDWPLAVSAFKTNRTTFINALIAEMDRLDLDGIDLDLEGIGSLDADRGAFNTFVQELSIAVKARGKILTIDTFHYIWNAPNQSWWPDWVGVVDNIHSMGYNDLYEGGGTYQPYSFQQNTGIAAGYSGQTVCMGMPSWLASWGSSSGRGTTAQAHVQEIRYDLLEPTGLAIWDLQLSGWQNSDLWCEIAELRGPSCPASGTPCDDNDPNTVNDITDGNCGCAGIICQAQGTLCDDSDACTTGDAFDANCNCAGTFQDADADTVCDESDVCPAFDDTLIGTSCDDANACTVNDLYTTNCLCEGTFADADADGVCDTDDLCAGFDDNIDLDADGVPDGCDACIDSAEAVDGCIPTAGTVDLSLINTLGGPYSWYDSPTSTTVLETGTTFTTPSISTTTTYYVGEGGAFTTTVGPPTTGNGFMGVNDWISPTEISFDVLQSFTLKGLTIRALIWAGTHQISFEIKTASGVLVSNGAQSFSITGTAGGPFWHPLTLSGDGVDLPVGSYTMTITSGVGIGHWTNVAYPVADAYLSITSSNQAGQFAAFHDWIVEGGSACSRIPVVAEVGGSACAGIRLDAAAILQGPYNGSLMNTALNNNSLIPLQEPYTAMGWHNGTETSTNTVLAANAVVDWVLVELRDRNDASIVVESRAGLLLEDGAVVDVDGTSLLSFSVPPAPYFVAIRHRNHLAVMTLNTVDLAVQNAVDFKTLSLYGGAAAANNIGGVQALWAGDATGNDANVDASDRSATWNNRNQNGYLSSDCDLSGTVEATDRSITWNNRNRAALLP